MTPSLKPLLLALVIVVMVVGVASAETCGSCVCPDPEPTPNMNSDLCTQINSTHTVCSMYSPFYSGPPSCFSCTANGVLGTLALIGVYLMYRYLTTPANDGDKK